MAAEYRHKSAEIIHKCSVKAMNAERTSCSDVMHYHLYHSVAGGADSIEHLLTLCVGSILTSEYICLCKAGANNADIAFTAKLFSE